MTLAELTSLDELLYAMMLRGYLSADLVAVLWAYYGPPPTHTRAHAAHASGMASHSGCVSMGS
jgi:hypothetical protein